MLVTMGRGILNMAFWSRALAVLLLCLLAGCSAVGHGSRAKALAALAEVRAKGAREASPCELRSIEDAVAKGELVLQRDGAASADPWFSLAYQKGRLLSSRLENDDDDDDNQPCESPSVVEIAPPVTVPPASALLPVLPPKPEPELPVTAPPSRLPVAETVIDRQQPPQSDVTSPPQKASRMIGEVFDYSVKSRETLRLIGAKLGVSWRQLAKLNGIDPNKPLRAGQILKVDTRRIVPKELDEGIVINIPDRTLYFFKGGELQKAIPVAVGKPKKRDVEEQKVWHTPTGRFRIVAKEKDPTWRVPPSIQKEMEAQGRHVLTEVPPGDKNPLGKYAMRTSIPGILIHSTNSPESVYTFSSHGCVRVFPDYMEEFFGVVEVNTPGEIIYKPVKVTVTPEGRVLLEIHPDIYEKIASIDAEVTGAIRRNSAETRVDWEKVRLALKRRTGIPEDVTI
ncbi:MAG: LysM peptidoglycan-binding domain-containing protein [Desulfuromonadales bacterium]|nr:MAG: LysM peptidoglycan-binding domain-containing protein [Desulfuromonadales bacterium]